MTVAASDPSPCDPQSPGSELMTGGPGLIRDLGLGLGGGIVHRAGCLANGEKAGEGERIMRLKGRKAPLPTAPHSVETSTSDREVLTRAYQAGLILAWKRDAERGFRLTLAGRPDEYVEVTKLTRYLAGLEGAA